MDHADSGLIEMDEWDDDHWEDVPDEEPESDVLPCPACGAAVYEDAVRCPVCGEYITHSTNVWAGQPAWWVLLGLAGIVAVVWALARF